ncbi:MAG: AAA family ATPase [bacterium]|nr:AAA family ATPase [bacterium]
MTQQEALDILKMGHHVFLTGEAGTGKTHVLNKYIAWLREHAVASAVTASTGIAATHLSGVTLHSWSGIGVRDSISPFELEQMEQKKVVWERLNGTKVLIIDEISMLSGEFFDMLHAVLRHMRRTSAPFGGLQVICCGDFFQLPPVVKEQSSCNYAFESASWKELNPVVCYLEEQYRQGGDEFSSILSAIRGQSIEKKHNDLLVKRGEVKIASKKTITRLFTHNVDVDTMNEERLQKLSKPEKSFVMQTAGKKQYVDQLMRGCLAPKTLFLRKGAEVMFIKNSPEGEYVNGTRGKVIEFKDQGPVVKTLEGRRIIASSVSWKREEDGKVLAEIRQLPLRLAWAITVHKSQGMTLNEAEMDLSRCFVPGQGYVALSRVRSLDGLYVRGFNDMALAVDSRVASADVLFQKRSKLAKERLLLLLPEDLKLKHDAFIVASGGSLEPKESSKNATWQEKKSTLEQTRELLEGGMSIDKIALARKLTALTIISHAEKLLSQGASFDFTYLAPKKEILPALKKAIAKHGFIKLTPVKRSLESQGHNVSFDVLRKARLALWEKS